MGPLWGPASEPLPKTQMNCPRSYSTDKAKEHLKRSHQVLFSVRTTEISKEISTSRIFLQEVPLLFMSKYVQLLRILDLKKQKLSIKFNEMNYQHSIS